MAQIRITPEELRDAAQVIQNKKEELSTIVREIVSKVEEVYENWEGAAQCSFVDTFTSSVQPILEQTTPEVLEGVAAQLNGAADTMEDADESLAGALRG